MATWILSIYRFLFLSHSLAINMYEIPNQFAESGLWAWEGVGDGFLGNAGRCPVVFQEGEKDKDAQIDTFAF